MYSRVGLGLVQVEFFLEDHGGGRRKLNQFKTPGYEVFLVSGKADLDHLIGDMVRRHRGVGALVVNAKIATEDGWETVYREERFDLNRR
jgi:hypothetical protein